MKPYLLALVAALAVVLAHEPFHVWPLAYVGLAVLAHLTWDDALSSRRRRAASGSLRSASTSRAVAHSE